MPHPNDSFIVVRVGLGLRQQTILRDYKQPITFVASDWALGFNRTAPVKRLIAILLFAAFILPFALPAFALGQDADAGLPACCRRTGAHHCAMGMAERTSLATSDSKASYWHAPLQHCPFCPASVASYHQLTLVTPSAQAKSVAFFSRPYGLAQNECRRRIARDRSRQKRGPPVEFLA